LQEIKYTRICRIECHLEGWQEYVASGVRRSLQVTELSLLEPNTFYPCWSSSRYVLFSFSSIHHNNLLMKLLSDGFRRRTFGLLASAFSNISEGDCAAALGLSIPETITFLTGQGWKHEGGFFLPKKPEKRDQRATSQQQLQQLTEYILFLEQAM
jgi:hypothetical protein